MSESEKGLKLRSKLEILQACAILFAVLDQAIEDGDEYTAAKVDKQIEILAWVLSDDSGKEFGRFVDNCLSHAGARVQ